MDIPQKRRESWAKVVQETGLENNIENEESGYGRYEFYGKGRDLYKAIVISLNIVPKGFVDVSAERFLRDPMRYGYEGKWIDREVESG
jgi:hypothetical protein